MGEDKMQEMIAVRMGPVIVREADNEGLMKQTILLVEDETIIRGLMCEVLEREGYKVLACADPKEGIETCLRNSAQIDLLLTDVVMPGMNGREMANQILEILPELRVVFMSGYTEQALLQGELSPRFEYLQKPFTLETLTRKLAQALAQTEECIH
jgi:CheY-like chemotaxis protein